MRCCGAEAEEDGVSCLAGDEGAVGVEDGGVEETGDEAANYEDVGCMRQRDFRAERLGQLRGGSTGRGGHGLVVDGNGER